MVTSIAERYERRESHLHALDARVKVVAVLGYIVAVSATAPGAWLTLALLALPVAPLVALSRLPVRLVLGRTMLALPFLLAAVPLVFTREGTTVFTVPGVGWTASDAGFEAVGTILARSWISVALGVLLTATTPAVELVRALRSLGVPRVLASTVLLAYRYIFVIAEEAQRLMRARDARSGALPGYRAGGSVGWRGRVLGAMVGSLFLRSIERSERVYAAMLARGYDGTSRTLEPPSMRTLEVMAGACLLAYGVAVAVFARV